LRGFGVPLFFFAQLVRQDGNDALANRVAVLDKFNFIACETKGRPSFCGTAGRFFSRVSRIFPFFQSLAQDQFLVAGQLRFPLCLNIS